MTMRSTAVFAAISLALAGPLQAALVCDADLDDDGAIGVTDLLSLLGQWGTDPGGPPDFDGDGQVGVTDLLVVLGKWGPATFDYGPPLSNAEAEQIALEMLGPAGPLRPAAADYARIVADLMRIRHEYPALNGQTHTPAWVANDLIVNLASGAPTEEYECLNTYYQVTGISHLFSTWWVLTFAGNLNVEALVPIYVETPAVDFAEPNGLIGGENFWTPTVLGGGVWQWEVDDGFLDCFDGCDCHRFYVLETDALGNVTLISYQEFGQPWCEFN